MRSLINGTHFSVFLMTVESSAPCRPSYVTPSAPPGAAAAPGHSVFCSKIAIATQRQREQAFLLAQVDKSREPFIDKSRDISRAAPVTPSSIEPAHCLLQHSVMKQVGVSLRASTLSPVLRIVCFNAVR